jgi:quercetin dioxygenase-like cupin family protein
MRRLKELAWRFFCYTAADHLVLPKIAEPKFYAARFYHCQTAGTQRKESAMKNDQTTPETKGVTVKLLAAVDLGLEIEGMAGRQFRMRMVTIEPGGVYGPIHDHKDRPGLVYILQGTITDHRNGVAKEYGPGVGWPEDKNTMHWLENRGTTPAVEISVDIVRQ